MLKLNSPQQSIKLDIEPQSFEAGLIGPLGNSVSKVRIEVNSSGFKILTKKDTVHSECAWSQLREMKNYIRSKGRFSYFGTIHTWGGDLEQVIRVGLKGGQSERERLAGVFDKLPPDVSARKCPECSGPVIDDTCRDCGKSFTGQNRAKGLRRIAIGAAMLVIGIALTSASYKSSTGEATVFIGLILVGTAWIIAGLVGLLFGVRT
jgi:hypothetical protein